MSEKKIKVGDRVRYIHPIPHYLRDYIGQGDECIVSEVTDCGYYVIKTCESLTIESDELELIEPTDPRTAFLQELKELLTKYNVEIGGGCLGWDNEDPFVSFDSKDFNLTYCDDYCGKFKFPLTPDNIMDYEE